MAQALVSAYFVFDVPAHMHPPCHPAQLGEIGPVSVERTGFKPRTPPMDFTADVWAIRWLGYCWSKTGGWEHEIQPSSRTPAWLDDHRFTFAEAAELLDIETPNGPF